MNLIASLMSLSNVIDDETKKLFSQFCGAALMSGNPNRFVKDALRAALEPAPAPPNPVRPPMVDATVVSVKERK